MLSTEVFKSPCKHPNGLQWTKDGLYVIDQELDAVDSDDHSYYTQSDLFPSLDFIV